MWRHADYIYESLGTFGGHARLRPARRSVSIGGPARAPAPARGAPSHCRRRRRAGRAPQPSHFAPAPAWAPARPPSTLKSRSASAPFYFFLFFRVFFVFSIRSVLGNMASVLGFYGYSLCRCGICALMGWQFGYWFCGLLVFFF